MVFIIGGIWVIEGQFELGSLIAFSTYLGMAVGPVQTLLGLYVAVQRATVSLQRIRSLTLAKVDVDPGKGKSLPTMDPVTIAFDQVTFGYPDLPQPILDQASVVLPAGSKVGVYGPSGIGKSTLVDLIMRHFDPQEGLILIDDTPLHQLQPAHWRRSIAFVAQETVIMRGSIIENVRYAASAATRDQIMNAIDVAGLSQLVNSLPEGVEAKLGERGSNLSGGEKQRIAFARALLTKPRLLIFDEATAAVDQPLEHLMMNKVDELLADTTRIVISHRESPLMDADILLTIENGKLITRPGSSG